MKLKRIVEQQEMASPYYDLGKDFFSFTHAMDMATEDVKNKFEQAIGSKLRGKKIRARASRGYKQFEKDYDINAASVSLDDYYDNYVVVVKDQKNKEYFLKPGFKVQIVGPMDQAQPEQPEQPAASTPTSAPQPQSGGQQSAPTSLPQSQAQPEQPPVQTPPAAAQPQSEPEPQQDKEEVKENDVEGTELVKNYSADKIIADIQRWLSPLLSNRNANLKTYVPRDGVSRTSGRKNVTIYGLSIPQEDATALTSDQIKQALDQATKTGGMNDTYLLDKFDVRGGKYIIFVKKISTY